MNKRIESKFVVSREHVNNCNLLLIKAPSFKKIFNDRKVSSIYFDDLEYSAYHENIDGDIHKEKYRIRYYNDKTSPLFFEIKKKSGILGSKEIFKYSKNIHKSNSLKSKKDIDKLLVDINLSSFKSSSLLNFLYKFPVLKVSYIREYYQCSQTGLRLTIDRDIKYSNINEDISYLDESVIVELKTDYLVNTNEHNNLSFFKKNIIWEKIEHISKILFNDNFHNFEFRSTPMLQVRSSKYSFGLSKIFSLNGEDNFISEEYIRSFF